VSLTDTVTVSTTVAVDPATGFSAFTSDVDTWWRRGPRYRFGAEREGVLRFEPQVGGRFLEIFDEAKGDAFEIGRVLVWEPGVRLVFQFRGRTFRPGELTEVEVRFEPTEEGTRVTLEQRGWDRLPADHPARHGYAGSAFTGLIGLWWADQVTALRGALSSAGTTARPSSPRSPA
jgi:uncharacterized protein YndB with AHSA1/START domain